MSLAPSVSVEDAAAAATAVFIGTPQHHTAGAVCASRRRLVDAPAPKPVHDKSVFHDRHAVMFNVVEVVKDPSPGRRPPAAPRTPPGAGSDPTDRFEVVVAVALAENGAKMTGRGPAYGEAQCQALDKALTRPFVVIFGRPVYVDRGNASVEPWMEGWTLGTDPTLPNRGFDSLDDARAYVATVPR